jgi:predicted amidohydrolase YtcJ
LFAAAHAAGDLPQRITLMSAGELAPRPGIAVGPVKILLDEADLPDIEALVARLAAARRWGRRVAVHCATAVELAFALAVFETAGVMSGDRIEHASVVPEAAIEVLARLRLTVVTQPGFIAARGDRYMREIPPAEHADLYRLGRLRRAGVRVAASSDAPYGPLDPWAGMRAAVERRTHDGWRLGPEEAVGRAAALSLYLGGPEAPAGAPRRLVVGAPADLCLLTLPLAAALEELDAAMVAVTLVGGRYSLGAPTAAEETLETPACARSHVS